MTYANNGRQTLQATLAADALDLPTLIHNSEPTRPLYNSYAALDLHKTHKQPHQYTLTPNPLHKTSNTNTNQNQHTK
ncbi:hypothetical protein, partial [Bradyrhizobium canariense]|uniref:hypothetical protein n=1 Tax=Bradyrhizobium canariense TaxID=255045 RepID=UPI001AEC840F